jgi:hypothetical protein
MAAREGNTTLESWYRREQDGTQWCFRVTLTKRWSGCKVHPILELQPEVNGLEVLRVEPWVWPAREGVA